MAQAELDSAAPLVSPTVETSGPRPGLRRSRTHRLIGGVAGGLAEHLGVDVFIVRFVFVALTLAAGFGFVVYILLWILAPSAEAAAVTASTPPRRVPTPRPRAVLGAVLVIGGVIFLLATFGLWFGTGLGWPVVLAAIGFAVLWARDPGERGRIDIGRLGTPVEAVMASRESIVRIGIGAFLIVGGMGFLIVTSTSVEAATSVVVAVLVTAGGLLMLAGPWIWNAGRALMEERSSRIRSEERAEMAAHLHDSVLQTLALIQRAREPREMATLARTQERELRAWLYGRAPAVHGARLRDAIDAMATRIERRHRVRVDTVVVGDVTLDDRVRALVSAVSEATQNAAQHSGAGEVSVYVEVEADAVAAFVRDQGRGFDRASVPDDRRGIRESVEARMARHGGTVIVTTEPGRGTEVAMRLPRRP